MGRVLRCDKLRDGSIEVEFATATDAAKALKATAFSYTVREEGERREVSVPMAGAPQRTKNSIKGIITCFDLRDVSDEEIAEGLSSHGVTNARRIKSRRGGDIVPTDNIVLTFNGSDLPPVVVVGYVRVKVRAYIPNPMRCFRCQRFGHTRTHCNGRPTCSKCASTDHIEQACDSDTLRCVNCGEGQTPHASYDRSCPKYAEEKEINGIKTTRNITFREAREIYQETHPKISYAQKAKAPIQAGTSINQMTATQLLLLLKSFGLSVVATGAAAEGAVPTALSDVQAACQTTEAAPVAPSPVPQGGADEHGWTLVRGRRQADRMSPPPAQATETPTRPRPPKVDEAIRRGEEERRAREAKRARLAQKAKEARRSPGADSASAGSSRGASATPETPQAVNPPSMGPPPPPPLPQRRPAPPLPAATPVSRPLPAASTSSRQPQPPSGPARPAKRAPPWAGSPTEGPNPRTRQRFQSNPSHHRSISADGRVHHEAAGHTRIHFGESASSDAEPV